MFCCDMTMNDLLYLQPQISNLHAVTEFLFVTIFWKNYVRTSSLYDNDIGVTRCIKGPVLITGVNLNASMDK